MPVSGITLTPEVLTQWNGLRLNTNVNHVQIGVVNEQFTILTSGAESNPEQLQQLLAPADATYLLIRIAPSAEKFFIVFYVPLKCKVANKMIYSSSLNGLKNGLGTDYLQAELYITEQKELTQTLLSRALEKVDNTKAMTYTELLAIESAKASIGLATSARVSVDLLVRTTQKSQDAFAQLQSGAINTAIFTVCPDTQDLDVTHTGNYTAMNQIQAQLNDTQPVFVFMKYNHQNPTTQEQASKNIFVYYCPNKAHVKLKMIYSSAKAELLKLLNSVEILQRDFGYEASEAHEVNDDNTMKTIYPPSQKIERVAKPMAPHLRRKQQQQQE